ncbi:MAG: retroviral-like aspartic protease family protein [Defluviitaleaceae bacterium]|nr:retroviral-like aspartic protease family protein [Defluviitaleaceae bacterium]
MKLLLSLPLSYKQTIKADCFLYPINPQNKPWKDLDYFSLNLLIDTGASQTAITRRVLLKMGYSAFKKGATKKITAPPAGRAGTGFAEFETTNIARLSIAREYAFTNLEVEVLDWKDTALHGVVGMDILSQFYIYSDKKTLTIQTQPFQFNASEVAEKDQKIAELTERIKHLENAQKSN